MCRRNSRLFDRPNSTGYLMAIIKRIDYYGIAFVLSISLIIATFLGGRSLERMRSAGNDINVKSVAEKRITSNLASWRGQITLMDKNLANGYDRLQKQYQTSVDYLKIKGIRDKTLKKALSILAPNI